ncbi:MAG: hypothetical protein AVDCRST_MAG19-4352, partial [uncultured Thermomicrobiales bacterium]
VGRGAWYRRGGDAHERRERDGAGGRGVGLPPDHPRPQCCGRRSQARDDARQSRARPGPRPKMGGTGLDLRCVRPGGGSGAALPLEPRSLRCRRYAAGRSGGRGRTHRERPAPSRLARRSTGVPVVCCRAAEAGRRGARTM